MVVNESIKSNFQTPFQSSLICNRYLEIVLLIQLCKPTTKCMQYCKNPKIPDTRKFAVITLQVEQDGFSLE